MYIVPEVMKYYCLLHVSYDWYVYTYCALYLSMIVHIKSLFTVAHVFPLYCQGIHGVSLLYTVGTLFVSACIVRV